jgi:hypothetical protein
MGGVQSQGWALARNDLEYQCVLSGVLLNVILVTKREKVALFFVCGG